MFLGDLMATGIITPITVGIIVPQAGDGHTVIMVITEALITTMGIMVILIIMIIMDIHFIEIGMLGILMEEEGMHLIHIMEETQIEMR